MRRIIIIIITICWVKYVQAQHYSIGVNTLGILVGSLNVEFSKSINRKTSFHLPISWNPFILRNNKKIAHLAIHPDVRWWFDNYTSGLFIGGGLSFIRYNAGVTQLRYDGTAGGVTFVCGYSKVLSGKWALMFETGAGLFKCSHDCYKRVVCGDYLYSEEKFKILPGKLSLSAVYIL